MKSRVSLIFVSLIVVGVGFQTSLACTVEMEPLRKTFRRAHTVFLADVTGISHRANVDYNKDLVDGDISFKISKTWKGKYRKELTLPGNIGWTCGCSTPDQFRIGTEYIIFIDSFGHAKFCESWKTGSDQAKEIEKQLDSFWFRMFARINPF